MDTSTTTRERDELLAGEALRALLGGEEGRELRERVATYVYDLRREVGLSDDEHDARAAVARFAAESSSADNCFPYTSDRLAAFAGSIHHATYADELRERWGGEWGEATNANLIGSVLGSLVGGALLAIGEQLVREHYDA